MSKEHKDPFMELLEAFFEGRTPHSEKEPSEPPTETKGFKSLVSAEEYEAITKLKEAMENYIEVHNKCILEHVRNRGDILNPYANIQYLILRDMVDDTMRDIGAMYSIHCLDKDMIDQMVKDSGEADVKSLEKKMTFESLLNKLKG